MSTHVTSGRIVLFETQSADEWVSQPIYAPNHALQTVVLQSTGTTSGGNVTIEEASWGTKIDGTIQTDYTGTWSVIQTIAASTFTGGAQVFVHISPTAYSYFRVRISDAITGGGSVSAFLHQGPQ